MLQCSELPWAFEIGKREAGDPAHGVFGETQSLFEVWDERLQFVCAGCTMEAANSNADGMNGAAAEHFEELVAKLFQRQAASDFGGVLAGEFNSAGDVEKVGGLKQMDVQGMTFDPFGTIEQPAKLANFR